MRHCTSREFNRRTQIVHHRAFTLIELVVSITVGAIIAGSAGMILMNATRIQSGVVARCELADAGAAALELMVRRIREIRQDECPAAATPCLDGDAQVSVAGTSELRFDEYGFRLNGEDLEVTGDSAATWHPLARNVAALSISYYDGDGAQLGPLPLSAGRREDIRRVSVDITFARASETVRLRTSVYLRNFMNEVDNVP